MDPNKIMNATTNASKTSGSLPKVDGLANNVASVPKASTPTNSLPNNTPSNINPTNSLNQDNNFNLSNGGLQRNNELDLPEMKKEKNPNQQVNNQNSSLEENPQSDLKPGDKVDTGKKVGEDGNIEDSSTKKTLKAVGRGAAAYATGGQSIGQDKQIAEFKPVDKTIGVVSDTLDKVPGVEQITNELDEAGLADGVNDVLDTVGSAKNGDIAGTIESGKKVVGDVKKAGNYTTKKVIKILIPILAMVLLSIGFIVVICGPVIGGFLDVVEIDWDIKDVFDNFFDDNNQDDTAKIIGEIPDFENLSDPRKQILQAAASAVANKVPYSYGSHPYNSGLRGIPEAGLDCAGFVQWALWTGLDGNPGYLTTQVISDKIGTDFIEISESELKPGDIGLKRRGGSSEDNYNHTGIYAGNNQWFHAAGGKTKKVVRGSYSGFTIYLRYKGVD